MNDCDMGQWFVWTCNKVSGGSSYIQAVVIFEEYESTYYARPKLRPNLVAESGQSIRER